MSMSREALQRELMKLLREAGKLHVTVVAHIEVMQNELQTLQTIAAQVTEQLTYIHAALHKEPIQ